MPTALLVSEITCPSLPDTQHLHSNGLQGLHRRGDKLRLWCDSGFHLEGATSLKCGIEGEWDSAMPRCLQINCSAPPNVENAENLPSLDAGKLENRLVVFPVDTSVHYTCSVGFNLTGRDYVKCLASGDWESYRPSCARITCSLPMSIPSGNYDSENVIPVPIYGYQSLVHYSCMQGYNMVGGSTLQCLASGAWNASAPSCQAIMCPSPDPLENGVIELDAITYGSKFKYKCNVGFRMEGNAERECLINGSWSGHGANCEIITCPEPVPIEHGFIQGDDFTYSKIIHYFCEGGYVLNGNQDRKCTKDGQWTSQNPKCLPVQCPVPKHIQNGHIVGSKHKFMDTVEYACSAGFRLIGVQTRECLENATWSHERPHCEQVMCEPPKPIKYGQYSKVSDKYLPGSVLHYTCQVGYELSGKAFRTCREDGTWTGRNPDCDKIHCSKPRLIKHGKYNAIDKAFGYGAWTVYFCEDGFQLDGPAQRMCSKDKSWTGSEPECIHIECPEIQEIQNGSHSTPMDGRSRFRATEQVEYKCDVGFTLQGAALRSCDLNGTWLTPEPHCEIIECHKPSQIISNGRMISSVFTYMSTIHYVCNPGFEIDGSANRTCKESGLWDNPIPRCERVSCPTPEPPIHGQVEGLGFKYGQELIFHCDQGYKLQGPNRVNCTASRVWSSNTPSCVRVQCPRLGNITHGNVHLLNGSRLYQDLAMFSCQEGFYLDGAEMLHCTHTGFWSDAQPVCSRIMCGPPPAVEYALSLSQQVEYGDTPEYQCQVGFVLDSANLTCQGNGSYIGQVPSCVRIHCPDPGHVEHGHVILNGTAFEDSISYTCRRGYTLQGNAARTCLSNTSWTGSPPLCQIVTCEAPEPIANAFHIDNRTYKYDETLSVQCHEGFEIEDDLDILEISCLEHGNWSMMGIECIKVKCEPPMVPNGIIQAINVTNEIPNEFVFGSRILASCDEGHSSIGQEVSQCSANKTWVPELPFCEANTCQVPVIEHALLSVDTDTVQFGSNLTVSCIEGFHVVGEVDLYCALNGTWLSPIPSCHLVTCTNPSFQDGKKIVIKLPNRGVGYPYGITLKFECNQGFQLNGSITTTCRSAGVWSEEIPHCVPIQCPLPDLKSIPHLVTSRKKQWFDRGDLLDLDCEFGYNLTVGADQLECLELAKWSEPLNHVCEAILCDPPKLKQSLTANNPRYFTREYKVGDRIKFKCNRGWAMIGDAVLECLINSTWTSLPPSCEMMTCPQLNITNAQLVSPSGLYTEKLGVDTELEVQCNEGFHLQGAALVKCLENATWDSDPGQCERVECVPPLVENGLVRAGKHEVKFYYGDTMHIDCSSGYEIHGASELLCRADMSWSNTIPTCDIVNCTVPSIQNGRVLDEPQKVPYKQGIKILCNTGYAMRGPGYIRCEADSSWSDDIPVCGMVFCKTPVIENADIYINSEITHLDELPFNQTIFFTCALGFELVGTQSMTCQEGSLWSHPIPMCNRLRCIDPAIPHGSVQANRVQIYEGYGFGDSAMFYCEKGFYLIGQEEVLCLPNGTWSSPFPMCHVISCPPEPANIQHATIKSYPPIRNDNFTYATLVHVICHPGFRRIGDGHIACGPLGEWSGIMPVCHRLVCPTPANIPGILIGPVPTEDLSALAWNSKESDADTIESSPLVLANRSIEYGYGAHILLTCSPGYEYDDSSSATYLYCNADGTWNSSFPSCHKVTCHLPVVINGWIENRVYLYGENATLVCPNGHEPAHESYAVCQADRMWRSNLECVRIKCPMPHEVPHGEFMAEGFQYGDKIHYACNRGFILVGNVTRICEADKSWSGSPAVCERIDCGPPIAPEHGEVKTKATRYGSRARFLCNEGYQLATGQFARCMANGQWSETNPSCQPIECEEIDPIPGVIILVGGRLFDDSVQFMCRSGFELVGPQEKVCTADGIWKSKEETRAFGGKGRVLRRESKNIVGHDKLNWWNKKTEKDKKRRNDVLGLRKNRKRFGQRGGKYGAQGGGRKGKLLLDKQGKENSIIIEDDIPQCVPVHCEIPSVIPHGYIVGSSHHYQDIIHYVCDPGFRLEGSGTAQCMATRLWNITIPRCVIVHCPALDLISNGHLIGNDTSYGSVLQVICDFGYEVIGSEIRSCSGNGSWTGSASSCQKIKCQEPKPLENGGFNGDTYEYGSIIQYHCDDYYMLFGPIVRTCQGDGFWTEMEPQCLLKQCPQPPGGEFVIMQADQGFMAGSHIIFDCTIGYNLVGSQKLQCKGDKWDGPFPSCKKVHCGTPKLKNDVLYEGKNFDYGDKIRLKCMAGYVLVGEDHCTCDSTGVWEPVDQYCEPVSCGTPPYVDNTITQSREYVFGQYVVYQCRTGYDFTGNNLLQCNEIGDWVGETPHCEMISCGEPPVVHHATTTVIRTTYGSTAQYECNRGFILRGNEMLQCMGNGTWLPPESMVSDLNPVPRCYPVNCGPPPWLVHGDIQAEHYTLLEIANYSCHVGYR